MKMDYLQNIKLAISLGFEEVLDESAYKGKYYVKNNMIWIHDILALKHKLDVNSDQELKVLNYDVDSYYKYFNYSNEMVDDELESYGDSTYRPRNSCEACDSTIAVNSSLGPMYCHNCRDNQLD